MDPAPRSQTARNKEASKRTAEHWPVHSFQTLLDDLGTLTKNRVQLGDTAESFYQLTQPTAFQQHVLELIGVTP